MLGLHDPRQNHLLAALPESDLLHLLPHLELVTMTLGQVIYESGIQIHHAYFPTTSIISLLYAMEDGSSSEIAMVGNDGLVGVPLIMGSDSTTNRAVVRNAGFAYRLKSKMLKEEFNRTGPLQNLFLRYTQALLSQMAQTAACNRRHSLDQQLCRCLLQSLDRLPTAEMTMTHELISQMLGVRREGVTESAGNLQKAGLIEYHRGHITIRDRAGLEARVCECYAVVKQEFDRLLPEPLQILGSDRGPPISRKVLRLDFPLEPIPFAAKYHAVKGDLLKPHPRN